MKNRQVRVLLIEDDEDDYVLVKSLLSKVVSTRYDIEWVRTYEDALKAIDGDRHDVFLLDYYLGDHNGLELLREINRRGLSTPVIRQAGGDDVGLREIEDGRAERQKADPRATPSRYGERSTSAARPTRCRRRAAARRREPPLPLPARSPRARAGGRRTPPLRAAPPRRSAGWPGRAAPKGDGDDRTEQARRPCRRRR